MESHNLLDRFMQRDAQWLRDLENSQLTSCTLDAARFVHSSIKAGHSWEDVIFKTDSVAAQVGLPKNCDEVNYIKHLASNEEIRSTHGLSQEAVEFLRQTAIDGRYIDNWRDDVGGTAGNLGIDLSEAVESELNDIDFDEIFADAVPEGYVACAAVALAVVVGAVVASGNETDLPPVFDFAPEGRL